MENELTERELKDIRRANEMWAKILAEKASQAPKPTPPRAQSAPQPPASGTASKPRRRIGAWMPSKHYTVRLVGDRRQTVRAWEEDFEGCAQEALAAMRSAVRQGTMGKVVDLRPSDYALVEVNCIHNCLPDEDKDGQVRQAMYQRALDRLLSHLRKCQEVRSRSSAKSAETLRKKHAQRDLARKVSAPG